MSKLYPVYEKLLQQDRWIEIHREMMVPLLAPIGFRFARLTRLEDKRIWEVYYDLDDLAFQFDTPDELVEAFARKRHPTIFMATSGWKCEGCVGNEVMIGILITLEPETEDKSK